MMDDIIVLENLPFRSYSREQKSPPRGPFSKPALLVLKNVVCMWARENLCFQKYADTSGQGLRANNLKF